VLSQNGQKILFVAHLCQQKLHEKNRFPFSSNIEIAGGDPQIGQYPFSQGRFLSKWVESCSAHRASDGFTLL